MTVITSPDAVGSRMIDSLIRTVGDRNFNLYFHDTSLECNDGQLELTVPNRFVGDCIEKRFTQHLLDVAKEEFGQAVELVVKIEPTNTATSNNLTRSIKPAPRLTEATTSSPKRRSMKPAGSLRYMLGDFVVGPSNELAYTCAKKMIEPGSALNPLFIHGGCGLGKTHLIQGICRLFQNHHPKQRWRYMTAEQFTNEYIHAIRTNQLSAFRQKLRRLDLLAIDDVQFMANKNATQSEFLHTFDAIGLNGSKVIMACDAPPRQIKAFSEALVSRFISGMIVQIDQPDLPMRKQLVVELARRRGLRLQENVIDTLAESTHGSIREMEGMMTQLNAVALVQGIDPATQPIGQTVVGQLFQQPVRTPGKPVRFEQILRVVCDDLNVEREIVLGKSRHRKIVLARSIIVYLARRLTTLSFPELAHCIKRTSHSTVITAAKRIEKQINEKQSVNLLPELTSMTVDVLVDRLHKRICSLKEQAA